MQTLTETQPENPMRSIRLEKVTVHIGVGKSGEVLEKARNVLNDITGQKPCTRQAKKTIKDFGISMGEPIACMTTLRGEKAATFLKRAFEAAGNTLRQSSFDNYGNFSFGIKEHIEIPGTRYVPELGIFGMDVTGTLSRPGYRVKRRRMRSARVGKWHRISREEAVKFVAEKFGIQIREV